MKTCYECEFFNRISFLHKCPAENRSALSHQCKPMIRYQEEKEMKNMLIEVLMDIRSIIDPNNSPEAMIKSCHGLHPRLEKLIEQVRNQ